MESNKGFKGHITVDFDFNIVDMLKCHFRVFGFAVLSFRADMVIMQTMVKLYPLTDIRTKGLYTTIIPLSSLKEYDYDCNLDEVNVMITKVLVDGLPSSSKIGCINVVRSKPFRIYGEGSDEESEEESEGESNEEYYEIFPKGRLEEAVEVSFDIVHINENVRLKITKLIPLGIHVNEPLNLVYVVLFKRIAFIDC